MCRTCPFLYFVFGDLTRPDLTLTLTYNLFNKFQKVSSTQPINPDGTGLGLALVKEICAMHHGWVQVESKPNELTTFSVWLPKSQY